MGYFYNKGERKVRPGLYQRYENRGTGATTSALVGYCAITIQADWGPLNQVVTIGAGEDPTKTYGVGGTVADVQALFDGGANTVYACRIGTGGAKASHQLTDGTTAIVKVEAKYEGTRKLAVSVKELLGDTTKKEFIVSDGATILEKVRFTAGSKEADNLVSAVTAFGSEYVTVTKLADGKGTLAAVQQVELTGGQNPTVTTADYSTGFNALETYEWNTISVDTDATEVHGLLANYIERVYEAGKFAICVIGEPTTISLQNRFNNASAYNSELVVYFGGAWIDKTGATIEGHLAVNHVAGIVASTPSYQSIVHTVIRGASDLVERLTNEQYIQAIESGCLMLSVSPDKQVWFDAGMNTLLTLSENQDAGWKKIKRVAIRNEMMQRIDKAVARKVGKVNNDADGLADVLQTGQAVLNEMVAEGGKIAEGATFSLDAANPPQGDEAWFIIEADDIDAIEKIYLQYRFRYSQLA